MQLITDRNAKKCQNIPLSTFSLAESLQSRITTDQGFIKVRNGCEYEEPEKFVFQGAVVYPTEDGLDVESGTQSLDGVQSAISQCCGIGKHR